MKLNHINLCTSNVLALSSLLEKHFGFVLEETRGQHAFAQLTGTDGMTLVLMDMSKTPQPYPRNFHIGFILDDPQEVRTRHASLCADGYLPGPVEVMTRGRDRWTLFYHPAGDDLLIEVSAQEPA